MNGEEIKELSPEEYFVKFQVDSCPRCGNREVKLFTREKGNCSLKYKVYTCTKCKLVVGRTAI